VAGLAPVAGAFTLLGPLATWQTALLSYDLNMPLTGTLGPMNLGSEYRWNVPTVYYGFTSDFLNYFGERGAEEVDKAFAMLNTLPSFAGTASKTNIANYPMSSMRVNHRAQALGLTDVKSFVLQSMMFQLGAGDPTRFVYCIRNRYILGACPPIYYHVIKRNFDPQTLQYSSYINGDLWTYVNIIDSCEINKATLFPEPVDPMALLGYRHAPVTSQIAMVPGGFWTTFTQDDIAALWYMYRKDNYNVENIPPGVTGGTNFFGANGSPWSIPPWYLTNGYATNITSGTNAFIEPGLRGGVSKVTFTRVDYDSLLGAFFTPVTNIYTENVIYNGQQISQGVQRILALPDIIIDAADLQGGDTLDGIVTAGFAGTAWDNNQDITTGSTTEGPGVIAPPSGGSTLLLTLNNVGPIWGNQWPQFLSEADAIQPSQNLLWGSFDGSTNEPVVYPIGTSIEALEASVLGR